MLGLPLSTDRRRHYTRVSRSFNPEMYWSRGVKLDSIVTNSAQMEFNLFQYDLLIYY